MINVSIVIPVFNEEKNISSLIYEILENIQIKYIKNYEIIIIDDCSFDNTLKILQPFIDKKIIKYFKNKHNFGQSFSLDKGINLSIYNNIITLDGDGQNNPKDIKKLLELYDNGNKYSLVGGIREKRRDSLSKIYASKIANKVRSYILSDNCPDTGCSLKIFRKDIFIKFPYFDGIHRFLPALFSGFKCETKFINVDHRPRIFGDSKYNNISRLFRGIKDLIKVYMIIKQNKND